MNHKLMKRLGAALLACVMLFGALAGALVPAPAAAAEAAEAFGVSFAESYAKVGQPMTVQVQGAASDAITYNWTVDGKTVSTEASYTPTDSDLMNWIRVTVACGSDVATAEMFFSKLPVVYINTEGGQAITSKEKYIDATLTIQGNETYNSETTKLYDGATEIRGRGNSTWSQPKKPYRLKLDKKTDLFGMGKSKHWVLLANYMDESLLRNTLAYDLSGAMGMEQMSTVFVDVILNGDFVGNYQLCENIRIDDTRVDIFDWESFAEDSAGVIADAEGMDKDTAGDLEEYMAETDMSWITSGSFTFGGKTYSIANYPEIETPAITGGYLLELDEYYDEVSKFRTDSNQPIMFKNPEFVNTNKDMMNYVQTYVQAFEDAVQSDSYTAEYEGETLHYSELYDFDALVDYWLINEIFFNEELNKKSTYMYKDIDSLMYMGPIWDMDWSSGGEGQTYHTEQWATKYYSTNAQANQWYKFLIQDPWFFIKAQERYWEIRYEQVEAMMDQIDSSYELLKESAKANGERWGYKYDYKKFVDDLRNWFTNHLAWMDEQMATQESLRASLGYSASSRLALTLTDAGGNTLSGDTAKTAPADYTAAEGQSLKLTVQGGSNTDGTAVLYVNGRRVSETATQANSTTVVDVPAESLTASEGEKNVLEIQIEKADGSINASRYVTVLTVEEGAECQHKYTEVIPAVAATCTEDGLTEGRKCSSCGEILVAQETIPALGHTEVTNPDKEPTFDEPGMTGGTVCELCGEILSQPEEIPMLDYNEGIVPIPALTVSTGDYETSAGASEGPAELVLDDDFTTIWHTDWQGTSRENHWVQFEITGEYIVDGLRYKPRTTGNSNGTITEYEILVSDDGETFRSVATGTWENSRNWKVAEFEGEQVKYVRLQAVDTVGDNNFVFASAAEIRLTGVKNEGGEQPEPHEHSWSEWTVTTEPTCTETGVEERSCECGETETREVAALGHDYVAEIIEPTCTNSGYTLYTCSRCGHSYKDDPTEPEHKFDAGTVTAPTCVDKGYTTYTCTVCGLEYVDEASWTDALGHDFVNGDCTRCDAVKKSTFEDVKAGDFFFDPVEWAVEEGITTGATPITFNPEGDLQRAQFVTFLWRAAGKPEPTSTTNPFTDVTEEDFFYKAVLWAVEKGITNGISDTEFGPYETTNRAQAVTFLYRYMGQPELNVGGGAEFADVDPDAFYALPVMWAIEYGITNGMGDGTFGVEVSCNRAHAVTFLYRALAK